MSMSLGLEGANVIVRSFCPSGEYEGRCERANRAKRLACARIRRFAFATDFAFTRNST